MSRVSIESATSEVKKWKRVAKYSKVEDKVELGDCQQQTLDSWLDFTS